MSPFAQSHCEAQRHPQECKAARRNSTLNKSSALAHGFPLPQKCIDWNREVLKRELGLSERDIVDIPQLFFLKGAYAEAFFPDMVSPQWVGTRTGEYRGSWVRRS